MMPGVNYFLNAGVYLTNLVFGLYLLAVMLRFLLQIVRGDFHNPICQFLITVTNPVLNILRYWVSGYFGVDWSSILLMILLQAAEVCLISLLTTGHIPAIPGLVAMVASGLLRLLVYIYIVVIILQAVVSLVQSGSYSSFTILLYQLSAPLFRQIRRHMPMTAGIDWSPLIILVLLNLVLILFVAPLHDWGSQNLFISESLLNLR